MPLKEAAKEITRMTVYLLHFTTPYRHARHYLGSADDLESRLARHRAGNGARLVQVCADHGIDFVLARTWQGGREKERQLKRQKNGRKLCPICIQEKLTSGDTT